MKRVSGGGEMENGVDGRNEKNMVKAKCILL